MRIKKYIKIFSVLSALISSILYGCILFIDLDVTEFDQLILLLFPAQAFFILTCIFVIFAVFISKVKFNEQKFKYLCIILCSLLLVGYSCLTAFGYYSVYSCYTPDLEIEENTEYIQSFFPYHDVSQNQGSIDVETSVMFGTNRIIVSSYGCSSPYGVINYTADYFESTSPFMNLKFYLDKGVILPSDLIYVDAYTKQEIIEIEGEKITLFTKENSVDYGLFIHNGNKAIYAEIDNGYNEGISYEEFSKVIINQFELLEKAAEEKTLIAIPQK